MLTSLTSFTLKFGLLSIKIDSVLLSVFISYRPDFFLMASLESWRPLNTERLRLLVQSELNSHLISQKLRRAYIPHFVLFHHSELSLLSSAAVSLHWRREKRISDGRIRVRVTTL